MTKSKTHSPVPKSKTHSPVPLDQPDIAAAKRKLDFTVSSVLHDASNVIEDWNKQLLTGNKELLTERNYKRNQAIFETMKTGVRKEAKKKIAQAREDYRNFRQDFGNSQVNPGNLKLKGMTLQISNFRKLVPAEMALSADSTIRDLGLLFREMFSTVCSPENELYLSVDNRQIGSSISDGHRTLRDEELDSDNLTIYGSIVKESDGKTEPVGGMGPPRRLERAERRASAERKCRVAQRGLEEAEQYQRLVRLGPVGRGRELPRGAGAR